MDDFEAIRQLVARCAHAFDGRDVDAWLSCWTADGTLYRVTGDAVTGHAELAEYVNGFPGRGRHVVTNSVIQVDGDRATHRGYVQYFDGNAQHGLVMFGVYDDQLTRQHDGWRFRSRRATPDADDLGA